MITDDQACKIIELLEALLAKLEEIRCCVLDVETATEKAADRIVREA